MGIDRVWHSSSTPIWFHSIPPPGVARLFSLVVVADDHRFLMLSPPLLLILPSPATVSFWRSSSSPARPWILLNHVAKFKVILPGRLFCSPLGPPYLSASYLGRTAHARACLTGRKNFTQGPLAGSLALLGRLPDGLVAREFGSTFQDAGRRTLEIEHWLVDAASCMRPTDCCLGCVVAWLRGCGVASLRRASCVSGKSTTGVARLVLPVRHECVLPRRVGVDAICPRQHF
jgi:hypothetical protein